MVKRRDGQAARTRRRPAVEGLEGRQLLAATFGAIPIAGIPVAVNDVADGPGGAIWFTGTATTAAGAARGEAGYLSSLNPTTGAVLEFKIPYVGSDPTALVQGPDGNVWFDDLARDSIGRFDATTGTITEFPVPTIAAGLYGIAAGPDGRVYFTESLAGKVGAISTTTGAIAEYPLANARTYPAGIALGPDGDLYVAEPGAASVARLNPSTGAISTIAAGGPVFPGIAAGPDGKLWFGTVNVAGAAQVASLNPGTGAIVDHPGTANGAITTGPDGQVWFLDQSTYPKSTIDEINTSTGVVTKLGTLPGGPSLDSLATAADGEVYFDQGPAIATATPIAPGQAVVAGSIDDLGAAPGGSPSLVVYDDLKGDGTFDLGDPATLSDADGNYRLTVPAGTATIRVVTYPGETPLGPVATPSGIGSTAAGDGLTVPVAGGQVTTPRPLAILSTSPILPLTLAADPFGTANPSAASAEVAGLYGTILGRAPAPSELAAGLSSLKSGGSIAQVASGLLHSPEYDAIAVTSDYATFLGLSATTNEAGVYVAQMQKGTTVEQVAASILGSSVFTAEHPSDASFVTALYEDILGYAPTGADLVVWESALASGTTRANAATIFLTSTEAEARAIGGFYESILGRAPDAASLAYFVHALNNATSLADSAPYLFGSSEYLARATATVA